MRRVLRHNHKSTIYKRKNWQNGPCPKQIPLTGWKDRLTVQNMVNTGIWLQREGSAAVLLVFTGVLFSNSWAHREGWERLAATFPPEAAEQPDTSACLWSHSRQAFMRQRWLKGNERPHHWDPDLISSVGQFFMEIISKTKLYCKAVFTFFCRLPFSSSSPFSLKREGRRNGINATEKNFVWTTMGGVGREPSTLQK